MEKDLEKIEQSKCCLSDVRYSKGKYMGDNYSICNKCNETCEVYIDYKRKNNIRNYNKIIKPNMHTET